MLNKMAQIYLYPKEIALQIAKLNSARSKWCDDDNSWLQGLPDDVFDTMFEAKLSCSNSGEYTWLAYEHNEETWAIDPIFVRSVNFIE